MEQQNNTPNETPETPAYTSPVNPSFDHLDKLADEGKLTKETLQETLNTYAQSLEAEFKSHSSIDPANIPEYTKNFFKENVYTAAAQIVFLSNNAESESVRLRAAQIIIAQAFADATNDGDPIKELMKELAKND